MVVTSMQHHPHHSQGPAPPQHLQQHTRPSSIVHQQHHQAPSAQSQHPSAYSSHSIQSYQAPSHSGNAQHTQDIPYYAHQSPYSTPGTTSGYTSADTSDMMAAAQMPRPYPPIYHTPQSNSPASVASPSTHEHRSIYGQPPSQLQHQSMYYGTQQPQYSSMAPQAPSPYAQHAQQSHQSMTSQPSMMMSQTGPQHQMPQHTSQHAQTGMTGSPRHAKLEPQMTPQLQRPGSGPLGTPQPNQNGGQLSTPTGSSTPGINNNAAPGPIPATTPLVVRQDNNGVQWIAFEYSRDRVKMEYTIRCDVESVNTDELSADFRTEKLRLPPSVLFKRSISWKSPSLNPCLRGKRGLIQRAVDSWRNSNQDPRLRSRRVRRMAKMNNRKTVQPPHSTHIPGPSGPTGLSTPGAIGPGSAAPLGKPGMSMSSQMHHHHAHEGSAPGGGDEVGDGEYMDESHHHHQAPGGPGSGSADDVRPSHVFAGYPQQYPSHATSGSSMPPMHDGLGGAHHGPIAAKRHNREEEDVNPEGLFPDISKKRKFILVDDNRRGGRLRVRVQLESVDTKEIPDSFRKRSAVFPRSYFPREMQDPPPSATGSRFFEDDLSDDDVEVDGGWVGRSRTNRTRDRVLVKVPMTNGIQGEVAIPRMRNSLRTKEVRLNDLGYRMAWLNGRPFAGRTIFMQRALDCYRNKTLSAADNAMTDIKISAPHYETRVGKRRWNERMGAADKLVDDA
ncbi:hypothetical protein EKO27_g11028 [Xylaria grammica]|uniref:DUF8032 domain-containing protein n=1 Tax=Xylaria grammica TaxID=363999 RepID=A0A439CPM7_9PEZI|nr:hypothetical protein EKO27_g11028 [Xylaria grammica]